MTSHTVHVTTEAENDIDAIHDYLSINESTERANRIANGLFDTIETLGDMPARGNFPKELGLLGREDIRELHHGPYRIFYQMEERGVFVIAVADGRRDMQEFLRRRLER